MVGIVDTVPGVALVLHPHGTVLRHLAFRGHGRRIDELGVLIHSFVPLGRLKLRMHGLMREVQEIGLFLGYGAQPVESVIGELVGDVTLLRHLPAVDVETVGIRQVRALPAEAHPLIEAGLGLVGLGSHVPFADERGLVADLLQVRRKEGRPFGNRSVVVDDAMPVRINARQNRCAAWAAQRRRYEGVLEVSAFGRQAVELRCPQPGLRLHESQRIVAVVVGQNEDDIPAFAVSGGTSERRSDRAQPRINQTSAGQHQPSSQLRRPV